MLIENELEQKDEVKKLPITQKRLKHQVNNAIDEFDDDQRTLVDSPDPRKPSLITTIGDISEPQV
jgi:hypothetical protein